MSLTFTIEGGKTLKGSIDANGSKNAALALLAATLATTEKCRLSNVPDVEDVRKMIVILKSLGVSVSQIGKNELEIQAKDIDPSKIDEKAMSEIRASIMLVGALASRIDEFSIVAPGGCLIGSRPIDAHIEGLKDLGFSVSSDKEKILFKKEKDGKDEITLTEISITATISIMIACSQMNKPVTLFCAAEDYPVVETGRLLTLFGVKIDGLGTHTITITGKQKLKGASYRVMPDPIEAGTWMALAAATRSELIVKNVVPDFMRFELQTFARAGIVMHAQNTRHDELHSYSIVDFKITPTGKLHALKRIHNMPAPGFMPDLIPPLSVLLTQAHGTSLIHDWMYEARPRYITELVKMGASAKILNPHQAIIIGPTPLYGKRITSFDLRAGATLIIAALTATGVSTIDNIYQVDRGYEAIDKRLEAIGASIKRT